MTTKMYVSSSPHIHDNISTQKIMLDVIIALTPCIIASGIIFGPRALWIIFICVLSCVISEFLARKAMKRSNTIEDLSAVVTGILLAFNLPVSISPFIAAFGGVIAIVVVKQFFGGIGQNFVNPALCARIILMTSFPTQMSTFTVPFSYLNKNVDTMTTATPLSKSATVLPSYLDMFLGNTPGCIGEVFSLGIICGGIYLLIRKVISPVIPICFIGTVFILTYLLGANPIFHILSGGLLLGSIFMATDYVTSPVTFKGRIIFGIGCGIFTVLIRIFGSLPEGVSFAIILMNILVPHIENLTIPKTFGKEKRLDEKN